MRVDESKRRRRRHVALASRRITSSGEGEN